MGTLIVDGANVVGSRPDGWWRDRPGAAGRLHSQLAATDVGFTHVVLVLEGQARSGVPEGQQGPVRVVHAAADGDSTIVELVAAAVAEGEEVTVVTADRALAATVTGQAGHLLRPGWLLDRLG